MACSVKKLKHKLEAFCFDKTSTALEERRLS